MNGLSCNQEIERGKKTDAAFTECAARNVDDRAYSAAKEKLFQGKSSQDSDSLARLNAKLVLSAHLAKDHTYTRFDTSVILGKEALRRRKIDGCPIAGALQLVGDKWTMLVVRDLTAGPKRTTELLEDLHPISSRTLMGRLQEMEHDGLILRNDYGGLPRRVEYELTERGERLIPLLDALMKTGQALDCNQCDDRKEQAGYYCDFCPMNRPQDERDEQALGDESFPSPREPRPEPSRHPKDDSIVLL